MLRIGERPPAAAAAAAAAAIIAGFGGHECAPSAGRGKSWRIIPPTRRGQGVSLTDGTATTRPMIF